MPDDVDDDEGNDIERRWWPASFSLETLVFTRHYSLASLAFLRPRRNLSLSLFLLWSLLALVLRFAKLACVTDGSPLLS